MTIEQGFRLVTRALTVFFLFWVFADFMNLIEDVLPLAHHIGLLRSSHSLAGYAVSPAYAAEEHYFIRYYAVRSCVQSVEILLWLWAALALYRGAGGVRRFFVPPPAGVSGQPLP